MNRVGFVGWRGMVGSVLMGRMREENDFADIAEAVFFTTSQAGQAGPDVGKGSAPLRDAKYIADLGNMDAILTEFVLDAMETDAESLVIVERAEQLRPNPAVTVVHLVADSAEGDPRLNNKTLADWRAFLDANGFNDHWVITAAGVVG